MQIKIDLKIFIFIVIFCFTRQIEIYGLLMFFAFLHELGHLFAGCVLGLKPVALQVNPLGLSVSFRIKTEDYNNRIWKGNILAIKKLIIAASGPIVNLVLFIIFSLVDVNIFNISNEFLAYSNLLIFLFNLIPIYPLDGGRILRNVLHIITGLEDSHYYTNVISNISIIFLTMLASICIVYLKNVAIIFILVYLWYLIISENKLYNQRLRIYEIINKSI